MHELNWNVIQLEHVYKIQVLEHGDEKRKYIQEEDMFQSQSILILKHEDHMDLFKTQGHDNNTEKNSIPHLLKIHIKECHIYNEILLLNG